MDRIGKTIIELFHEIDTKNTYSVFLCEFKIVKNVKSIK